MYGYFVTFEVIAAVKILLADIADVGHIDGGVVDIRFDVDAGLGIVTAALRLPGFNAVHIPLVPLQVVGVMKGFHAC